MADILIEFIERTGDAGLAWVGEYKRHCHILRLINSAMPLLRSHKIEEAGNILQKAGGALEAVDIPNSVRVVLDQSYYKTLGLYHYRAGDFASASESMKWAHRAVAMAAEEYEFLIPFALQCPDLCINQARVARNQRKWEEMHSHISRVQAMLADRMPLCEAPHGPAVFYSTLRSLFLSIRQPNVAFFEELCMVMEEERRMPFYDRVIRSFFRFETIAIDYESSGPGIYDEYRI